MELPGGGGGGGNGGPDGSAREERMNKRAKVGELADVVDAGENLSN